MMMQRRGQAAMEFLLTYGWAILVALLVIGALAYFGVLNPQKLLPSKCELTGQVKCLDKQLTSEGNFAVRLLNGVGNPITVSELTFSSPQLMDGTCTQNAPSNPKVGPGGEETYTISGCTLPSNIKKGTRVRGELTLRYRDESTKFDHTDVGSIILDVE